MTQSLGARATSLAASAGLLGLAVFAALSVSITLGSTPADPPGVTILRDPIVPPDPPPVVRDRPLPPPVVDQTQVTTLISDPLPPPIVDTGPPTVWIGPPAPPLISNPRWLRQPRDLASYYPQRALQRNMTGQVVLDCLVDTSGALACSVTSETPANWGFAQAALRISRDYRMVPAMRDGQAVEGRYRMRVPFETN
ncbi:MAG: energy transducer TonB [Hyphomonadaceae bacterium]|nr:energy transducer TonB [Hyphomonadaceae bacterium]